jgi:hypothetical protein
MDTPTLYALPTGLLRNSITDLRKSPFAISEALTLLLNG